MDKPPTIGFISAPAWFDPAPSEFPGVCRETVRTQQAPVPLPDFDYRLESIAAAQETLHSCARSLKAIGCDLVAQVGSPFAWAGATSEREARLRCETLARAADAPTVMTGLAIVDGLRAVGARRIAVNCTYYDAVWQEGFTGFLAVCGFDIRHASTLGEQGVVDAIATIADYGWSMTPALAARSIRAVAAASPEADAIVVTGAGTRTLAILADMEAETGRPVIAADTVLYWAVARELGLSLKPNMGTLAGLA